MYSRDTPRLFASTHAIAVFRRHVRRTANVPHATTSNKMNRAEPEWGSALLLQHMWTVAYFR